MNEIGILENAYKIGVKRPVNELWTASFSLPTDDPKNELCKHFNFIDIYSESGRYYGKYRIMPRKTKKSESENSITYSCEHVLATLMDDVIDGYLPALINQTTAVNLNRILNLQETKHWVLGKCEITRYFQYAFENENGLLAPVLSIPKPFDEPYEFTFDTETYPWKLNLLRSSDDVKAEIRWGKDMIDFEEVADPTNIVNYIIPKGAGEGVNQLTIESVNNGIRYLKDDESIAKWGKKPYIWIDQRFTHAETLKANGEALLKQRKDPAIAFKCQSTDLSILPEFEHERKFLNGVTRIVVEDSEYFGRILSEEIKDLAKEHEVDYEIANTIDDIADVQADLERKQQVNEAYSQGSTNILNADRVENADPTHPIIFKVRIPADAVNVNFLELTWETEKFRGYTRGVKGGGAFVKSSEVQSKSTEAGGAFVKSSTVQSKSTEGGGAYVKDSEVKITDTHNIAGSVLTRAPVLPEGVYPGDTTHWHSIDPQWFAHNHTLTIPGINIAPHTHGFSITIPGISIPSHSHIFKVTIPEINIPKHTHPTEYGIYEHEQLPSKLEIKVDGTVIPHTDLQGENVDLTPYLQKDQNGKVSRDRFAVIEIRPTDELAQISANVIWGLFIQSHKGLAL